jgi:hypothetical protein
VAPRLVEWTQAAGENFDDLEELYGELLGQWNRYVGHVITLLGGRYQNTKTAEQGEPIYSAVNREQQEQALQFIVREALLSPTWLADKEILRRIEHAGAIERIRRRQVSILNRLLDPQRMQRIIESEELDDDTYTLVSYLDDLRDGVFSELETGAESDTYRRNLQRAYLERLEEIMTEEPEASSSRFATPVDVSQSDIRPLLRAQLVALQFDAVQASSRSNSTMGRAHLADLAERAQAILENDVRGVRVIED